MRTHNQYALSAFRRVQGFLDENAAKVGVIGQVEARKILDSVVAQMNAHAVDQGSYRNEINGRVSTQKSLETELRKEHMQPIADYARGRLRGAPGYAQLTVRLGRLKGDALVNAARSMAQAAAPYADALEENGFTDALAQLNQAADRLQAAIGGRGNLKTKRAGATKGISEQTTRGQEAVRMLNAVIERKFAKDATFLASWRSAKRISAKPGVPRGSGMTLVSESETTSPAGAAA